MNYESLEERNQLMKKAMEEYPEESNMTKAWMKFWNTLPQDIKDRVPLFLRSKDVPRPTTIFDNVERPKCPECQADLFFRLVGSNEEGINTQLVCSNKFCDVVLDSEKTIQEWYRILKDQE